MNHAPLITLDDALAYMVALPDTIVQQNEWQRAVVLALDVRTTPNRDRIAALTKQLELALFTTYRLDP